MAETVDQRVTAEVEGGIALLLIGMRINKVWKVGRWLSVLSAMRRMLEELARQPELGLLSAQTHPGFRNTMVVQYWESLEKLQAYAHAADKAHLPAWQAFYRSIGTNGDVGIWHETYVVPPGHMESLYVNMPRYGLGRAGQVFPATGDRATAARRPTLK